MLASFLLFVTQNSRVAVADPILVPTITYNYSFAYARVFGREVGGNLDPINGYDEGANRGVSSGFSVPGPDGNSAGAAASTWVDVPGSDDRLTYGRVLFDFVTPQTGVTLIGMGSTSQRFSLQGLAAPVAGQIIIDYSSLFAQPQVDTQGVDWSLYAMVTLYQGASEVARDFITQTMTGQLIYSGLLSPGETYSLELRAIAIVETLAGGSLSGEVDSLVLLYDWSIEVTAPGSATPVAEPSSLILTSMGLVVLGLLRGEKTNRRRLGARRAR